MNRTLTCIGCPMGCQITVTLDGGAVKSVEGNTCMKGDQYARAEVTRPVRTVTSSVPVTGGTIGQVSVKTAGEIPKDKIFDVMDALRTVRAEAPVSIGSVIAADICGTGVDIVATKNVERKAQ